MSRKDTIGIVLLYFTLLGCFVGIAFHAVNQKPGAASAAIGQPPDRLDGDQEES